MPWDMVREKYKIIRVFESHDGYTCAQAVDITERERPTRLLNLYEPPWTNRYARIFSQIQHCPALCEVFPEQGRLIAVFAPCGGIALDRIQTQNSAWSWQDRLCLVESLLHQVLTLSDLPYAVSCAALQPDNVRIWPEEKRVGVCFRLRPMPDGSAQELTRLTIHLVQTFLPSRFAQGDAEYTFCRSLTRNDFASIVPLYACWHRARADMQAEYEELDGQNALKQGLVCLYKQTKRWLGQKRR